MDKNKQLENLVNLKEAMDNSINRRIYATVTRVSASGESRSVKFYYVDKGGNIYNLNKCISNIMGYRLTDNGVRIGGCWMDVIFNTLYNINALAEHYGLITTDDTHNKQDLYYNGIVNTNYWSL